MQVSAETQEIEASAGLANVTAQANQTTSAEQVGGSNELIGMRRAGKWCVLENLHDISQLTIVTLTGF
jgi:hypothetical protein